MGVARLLAKGWVAFCLFAAAHALRFSILHGETVVDVLSDVVVPILLFTAMGIVFIAGYGAASMHWTPFVERMKPRLVIPGFNELVFIGFVFLSFINQAFIAPDQMDGPIPGAIATAVAAIVPGQRVLEEQLSCGLDGGRVFASSFAWILAMIYIASAVSRIKLTAGLIRMERVTKPEPLGPMPLALVLGATAIIGVQLLYVGSVYAWLPCSAFNDISGAVLIGLAPLMLAYLVVAAFATALAAGSESSREK